MAKVMHPNAYQAKWFGDLESPVTANRVAVQRTSQRVSKDEARIPVIETLAHLLLGLPPALLTQDLEGSRR